MGSFGGHAIPGTFFIVVGLWHTFQSYIRYYRCKKSKETFKSSTWHPVNCWCFRTWPVEPFVRVVLSVAGIVVEVTNADYTDGAMDDPMNQQHATMYTFFALNGFIEILSFFRLTPSVYVNNISLVMAYFVEFVLFKFHLDGRTEVDVLLHTLLLYVVFVAMASVVYMMVRPSHVLASLSYSFSLLLQGTWFWQIAFTLYSPLTGTDNSWDENSHKNVMVSTCYFTWHIAAVFILVMLVGAMVSCHYRRQSGTNRNEEKDMVLEKRISDERKGNGSLEMMIDSEEEESK